MTEYLYQDGLRYDRIFDAPGPDIGFWTGMAEKYDDPVLELACGTGRVCVPLAEKGFAVTGIDRSEAMLAEARRKAEDRQVSVEWAQGDIRCFDLDRRFSLIFIPANTLCHILARADVEALAACVKRHLASDGRFIVDVFVPDMGIVHHSSFEGQGCVKALTTERTMTWRITCISLLRATRRSRFMPWTRRRAR